jgi:arylsulfatase A-like enzyme
VGNFFNSILPEKNRFKGKMMINTSLTNKSNITLSFICALGLTVTGVQAKKNVLFLMADDFNSWVGASGYNTQAHTPNLDKLAKKGVLFKKAYNAGPVCNPSRNALQSGYRVRTTGVTGNEAGFVREMKGFEDVITMHQYFKENGYYALGAGKIYHSFVTSKKYPQSDFQNYSEIIDPIDYGIYNGCSGPNNLAWGDKPTYADSWLKYQRLTVNVKECDGYKVAQEVVKRIQGYATSANKDKPFFMAFGEFRPHLPFESPEIFWNNWKTSEIKLPEGYNESVWPALGVKASEPHLQVQKENKHQEVIHAYLASMAYADSSIGIVLDALEKSSYKDNTIVVFCGDHGFHLGEKGEYAKAKQWEQSNRTTLIIYDPSAAGNGKVSEINVSLQDLYPTLVELAGLPRKDNIEGISLAPLLDAPNHPEWNYPILISHGDADYLKTKEWSYLPNYQGKKYLFNRQNDPNEWKNVWNENPSVVANLQKQMDSIIDIGTQIRAKLLAKVVFKKTTHSVPGKIESEDYDDGSAGQDFFDKDKENTGGMYRKDAVDIKATTDGGGFEVTSTALGEWLKYTIPNFQTGTYSFSARVNAEGKKGKLAIYLDDYSLGEITINSIPGWQEINLGNIQVKGSGYKKLKVLVSEGNPSLNYFTFGTVSAIGKFNLIDTGLPKILKNQIVTDGRLELDLHSLDISVEMKIYTPQGKVVVSEVVPAEMNLNYDLKRRLPPGRYILQLEDWSGKNRKELFQVK